VLAILALVIGAGVLGLASARVNDGHFVYALDDAYISMAIAKNLARHGVWGVSESGFSASSSSLIWPVLLAATYRLAGVNAWSPLVLNLIFALALLWLLESLLRRRGLLSPGRAAALLVVVVLTPLPTMVVLGLEHTLHALLTVALLVVVGRELGAGESARAASLPWMATLAALLTATRYEGLACVFLVAVALALRSGWRRAAVVAAAGALPVAVFGWVSLSAGWGVVPNPILIKGGLSYQLRALIGGELHGEAFWRALADLAGHVAYRELLLTPEVLFLLIFTVALLAFRLRAGRSVWDPTTLGLALFIGQTLLHFQCARAGWFYRYEAYLIVLGIFAVAGALADRQGGLAPSGAPRFDRRAAVPLALLALLPLIAFAQRSAAAFIRVPLSSSNIYDLQYQMGQFVRENYQHRRVVALDIGALNFLADIDCLDLGGLGSLEPARLMLAGRLDSAAFDRLAQGAAIALVYPGFLERHGGPPPSWVEVGRWSIPRTVMMGSVLAFYAVDPVETVGLAERLRAFAPRLTARVRQSGWYLETQGADPTAAGVTPSSPGLPRGR
jgi:hypothetical protein